MSIENGSYIETVKPDLRIRHGTVIAALDLLRDIVNTHAFAEEDGGQGVIEMPLAYRDSTQSGDTVWFTFRDHHGDTLTPEDIGDENSSLDPEIDMMLGGEGDGLPVVTFTTAPPNVLGHDGAPLNTPQIERVITDLRLYEASVRAGHLAAPAGEPMSDNVIRAIAY